MQKSSIRKLPIGHVRSQLIESYSFAETFHATGSSDTGRLLFAIKGVSFLK